MNKLWMQTLIEHHTIMPNGKQELSTNSPLLTDHLYPSIKNVEDIMFTKYVQEVNILILMLGIYREDIEM